MYSTRKQRVRTWSNLSNLSFDIDEDNNNALLNDDNKSTTDDNNDCSESNENNVNKI